MEYQTRTYFDEKEADDVKGFTIIDTNDDSEEYHIAEKWNRTSNAGSGSEDSGKPSSAPESKWLQYWIPEAQLLARVEADDCEAKAQLTERQYSQVCDMIDHDKVTATPTEA